MKKICIVTATRAEYDLLYKTLLRINNSDKLNLELIVTGTHLINKFGNTYKIIEKDGFKITSKIKYLLPKSQTDLPNVIAQITRKTAAILADIKPDILLLLGDRYEIFATAIAGFTLQIPLAHIHGGEVTNGVLDDGFRHSISKMSYLHFVAALPYKERLIRMGENPNNIFNVGSPGIENLKTTNLISKKELGEILGLDLSKKTALITYHPASITNISLNTQMKNLFEALDKCNLQIVFTMPNADSGWNEVTQIIKNYVLQKNNTRKLFKSLGLINYLSAMKHLDIMIGNSSSGIIEAPSFNMPVVNIGNRQNGRLMANNIFNCNYDTSSILSAIKHALKRGRKKTFNYYENKNTSKEICTILENIDMRKLRSPKIFFDSTILD